MKINPTKCVVNTGFGKISGTIVTMDEFKKSDVCQSGISCRVIFPGKGKKPHYHWLDMNWLIPLKEQGRVCEAGADQEP